MNFVLDAGVRLRDSSKYLASSPKHGLFWFKCIYLSSQIPSQWQMKEMQIWLKRLPHELKFDCLFFFFFKWSCFQHLHLSCWRTRSEFFYSFMYTSWQQHNKTLKKNTNYPAGQTWLLQYLAVWRHVEPTKSFELPTSHLLDTNISNSLFSGPATQQNPIGIILDLYCIAHPASQI